MDLSGRSLKFSQERKRKLQFSLKSGMKLRKYRHNIKKKIIENLGVLKASLHPINIKQSTYYVFAINDRFGIGYSNYPSFINWIKSPN